MNKINKYTYLIFAICLFIAAAIIENGLLKKHPEDHLIKEFEQKLHDHEEILNSRIEEISKELSSETFDNNLYSFQEVNNALYEEYGIGIMIFQSKNLVYWSNRSFSFFNNTDEINTSNGLVKLKNGFYLIKSRRTNEFDIVGLHLIKRDYERENKYLQNSYFKKYELPDDFELTHEKAESSIPVISKDNEYLFSVIPSGQFLCTTNQLYFPGLLYFFGLLILLYYFRKEFYESKATFILKLFSLATALFLIYWLHILFKIPKVFFQLNFFSPEYFALNNWLPSLGDFFLLSLFFFFWLYNFGFDLNFEKLRKDSNLPGKAVFGLLLLFNASLFLLTNFYIEELVYNSTLSFSLYKITEISAQSVLGIFSVGLFLLAIVFVTTSIVDRTVTNYSFGEVVVLVVGISIFLAVVQIISIGKVSIPVLLFYIVSTLLATLFSKKYLQKFTLSYLITFVSLASVYSLIVIYSSINQKEKEQQKLLAVTLVSERDPAAEVLLAEINQQILNDPAIQSLILQGENLNEYIRLSYFNGYFSKYIVDIHTCLTTDSLIFEPENRIVSCIPFMEDLIEYQGDQIPGTQFYFMDNMNGRISYTGKFHYHLPPDTTGIMVYIDLDSDLLFEGIGFPELLIDKSMTRPENYQKFYYAKYYGYDLTDKYGDYKYNFHVDMYLTSDDEFTFNQWDGLEHLIYKTPESNYVIVSRELLTFTDYLISFPYLFVLYFLSVLVLLFIGNKNLRNKQFVFDLKFKIQAAIISIVFISLLLVALVTIIYNVEEYKEKYRNELNDKMISISEEIDMRLEDKEEITPELVDWLFRELAKLSNIFRTDINIYGTNGNLIASSRLEIFERGLISTRINTKAYFEIFENFQTSYFQPEIIGKLSYLSAYRPIINNKGEYLGFINLPYFINQDNYSQEISTFVVAFINLYVLLLLASIILAVFIANQITKPLVVIQENLQKIELGKRNEPIYYKRKDEIGSLVKEYNKKVDELAVSAELLARSERESAWREMAKQIAHEIKNPLTPMKLNIQYLQRTKGKDKEYNKYLERVTGTLIEQIENLSNIATEFSNFAKIPTARNQVINLAAQVQKVIDLYESHQRVKITFHPGNYKNIHVNADREQLSRAIINLIKNGIQAIPEDQEGEIKISLAKREHMAVIEVKDNGAGIPLELRDKLFSPSFTTKTSGMGLGLAIVKNIVENFAGQIWFETELGKGTTFFLEIPVYEKQESS